MIVANIDTSSAYIAGDTTQFGPTAPNVTGPRGCTKDLSMSIMEYLHQNNWPSAELWLQRRGAPGIGAISSPTFYRGKMLDAPCTLLPGAHTKTATILQFFKDLFPECGSDLPVRFIDLRGRNDLRDELTGSWYSPDEAAVIVSIIEKGIMDGVFAASDVPVITHYSAQQKVFRHAFAKLNHEFPGRGFDKLMDHTTDTFQGHGATMPIGSPVRTTQTGFSGDRGRNCVLMTRGEDFSLTVANVNNLVTNTGRGTPPMKTMLYTARTKRVAVVVKQDGPHQTLMSHRYVHPQVIGTNNNAVEISSQDFTPDPDDNPAVEEEVVAFNVAAGGGDDWGSQNAAAADGGDWGSQTPATASSDAGPSGSGEASNSSGSKVGTVPTLPDAENEIPSHVADATISEELSQW